MSGAIMRPPCADNAMPSAGLPVVAASRDYHNACVVYQPARANESAQPCSMAHSKDPRFGEVEADSVQHEAPGFSQHDGAYDSSSSSLSSDAGPS